MADYPKVWFLRHGQTEWNREQRLQGHLDSPLTEQGIADAERQRDLMREVLIQSPAVFVSPLGRARQTAEIVLEGASYQTDRRLMEIGSGAGEGRTRDEVLADYPHLVARGATALEIFAASEGAEKIADFQARICEFLRELRVLSVVIAHGLLGQVLRAEVRGYPLDQAGQLSNRQGVVYVLENRVEQVLEAR